jgi:hypothetical protein
MMMKYLNEIETFWKKLNYQLKMNWSKNLIFFKFQNNSQCDEWKTIIWCNMCAVMNLVFSLNLLHEMKMWRFLVYFGCPRDKTCFDWSKKWKKDKQHNHFENFHQQILFDHQFSFNFHFDESTTIKKYKTSFMKLKVKNN